MNLNQLGNFIQSMRDPTAMFNNMLNSNPQFRQFVAENQGKSPEQIASEHGIDLEQIKRLFK